MQKLILLLLTLTLIFGIFASCNSKKYLPIDDETSSSPSEDTTKETNDTGTVTTTEITQDTLDITSETQEIEYPEDYYYTVKEIDGKWYMNFDSYVTPTIFFEGYHEDKNWPFSSFEELYNTLIVDKSLTKEEKIYIIDWYYKTENGIEIINFDELYVPVLPSSVEMPSVYWYKTTYGVVIADQTSDKAVGQITYLKSSEKFDSALVEAGAHMNQDQYFLTEGDKTVVVNKRLSNNGIDIDLHIKHGDRYCLVQLFNITGSPADEFFLQFGLKKWEKPE